MQSDRELSYSWHEGVAAYLRVSDDTDELAVADHLLERILDRLLAQIVGPLLRGLGESLLLGRVPLHLRKGKERHTQMTLNVMCTRSWWAELCEMIVDQMQEGSSFTYTRRASANQPHVLSSE